MVVKPDGDCLICGSSADPSIEHIIPQALWLRFGLHPDSPDLERFRTRLCMPCNNATSRLHNSQGLLDLIEDGGPATQKSLRQLTEWAVWVTLLLGLRTGDGVVPNDQARKMLNDRFGRDKKTSGLPPGIRVYAAQVGNYVDGATDYISHQVGVECDGRIMLDHSGKPAGFTIGEQPITVSESLGIGKLALLVLPRTYTSGGGHKERLDAAASTVGLTRIHPFPDSIPNLSPTNIDMRAVSQVFMPLGHGSDASLAPTALRHFL